jgi:hypothetical protein
MITKDELLLQQVKKWWSCCRSTDILEGLRCVGSTNKEDLKRLYPEYVDEDGHFCDDLVSQLDKDVSVLFSKFERWIKQGG